MKEGSTQHRPSETPSAMPDPASNHNMVRSLRRRLWKAFQDEDIQTAVRAYTATRKDYLDWLEEERLEEEQRRLLEEEAREKARQERLEARPAALRKFGSFVNKSTRRQMLRKEESRRRGHRKHATEKSNPSTFSPLSENDKTEAVLMNRFCPSDPFVLDDYRSPNDAFDDPVEPIPEKRKEPRRETRPRRSPRVAGFSFFKFSHTMDTDFDGPESKDNDKEENHTTTPLHEAARLGSSTLVRLFLENGGKPSIKNGQLRTALHMVAGGMTESDAATRVHENPQETDELLPHKKNDDAAEVGIRRPIVEVPQNADDKDGGRGNRKKLGRRFHHQSKKDEASSTPKKQSNGDAGGRSMMDYDMASWTAQRMDALLMILSWSHPEDNTPSSGEGPSLNAVDGRGRTALHYAAELGRADVCLTILTSFGVILTIVDESSQTPCELAAREGHPSLAAELEARALLFADPYGMDEELLATMYGDDDEKHGRSNLCPPFSWFETWSTSRVSRTRTERLTETLLRMKQILDSKQEHKEAYEFIYNHGSNTPKKMDVKSEPTQNDQGDEGMEALSGEAEETSKTKATNTDKQTGEKDPSQEQGKETKESSTTRILSEYELYLTGIHEAHAEQFLAKHGWNVDKAMKRFEKSPLKVLSELDLGVAEPNKTDSSETPETVCLICCDEFDPDSDDWKKLDGCNHGFCTACLGDYVSECARSKDTGLSIVCPHHECQVPLTTRELEALAPHHDVFNSLSKTADDMFVSQARDLSFCNHPGCGGVVHCTLPTFATQHKIDHDLVSLTGAVCTAVRGEMTQEVDDDIPLTYEGVADPNFMATRPLDEPLSAHRFCFHCGNNMHWPVPCNVLEQWKEKIAEEIQELDELAGSSQANKDFNDIAQQLWMKANTRPCPKCGVPIEKNDGCNHMTCTNRACRHEFCWICRQDWKLHNTETGGFFRCNRWQEDEGHKFYDTPPPPEQRNQDAAITADGVPAESHYGTALHSARAAFKKSKEMGRFLHHYRRWTAHSESAELERKIAKNVCKRLAPVVEASIDFNGNDNFDFNGKGLSFIHAAFTELLESRSLLQHSYAFAYYRFPAFIDIRRYRAKALKMKEREKQSFERMQSELEMMTEQMSDIVARRHLRATQMQIMFLTKGACEKRRDFSAFMLTVLQEARKEEREERERVQREKKKPATVDRTPSDMPPAGLEFSSRPHRDEMPRHLSRLADPHYRSRNPYDDSDDDDDFLSINPNRHRLDDDPVQEAMRASMQAYFRQRPMGDAYESYTGSDVPTGRWEDWGCAVCTYMNAGGRRCAMCGAARS